MVATQPVFYRRQSGALIERSTQLSPAWIESLTTETRATTLRTLKWFAKTATAPKIRTIREFAEAEIVLPNGPFAGEYFSCDRQPYSRLWFEAIELGTWNRFFATGPSQTGKTMSCFIIPLLFHLFEIGETVICGVPSMDMAGDKWREDIKPAIEASRYRDLLPTSGQGSKGGMVEAVQFKHGPTLRFMSGGGGDKKRAGYTSRVLVITEVDGMDEAGLSSREADKITQLEARTRAFGKRKRIYGECTVSIEQGRTWQEYTKGTASRIFLQCPHCLHHVHPTRESLQGWQDAATEVEAEAGAGIYCPDCGESWSESDRRKANDASRLVHRGQEIGNDGAIVGELPQTNTLGFRWDAINNLFVPAAEIGAEEWKAKRAADEDNAEKEMRQFVWALPHEPNAMDAVPLDAAAIINRKLPNAKGTVPDKTELITVGIDVGKWLIHWCAVAWRKDGSLINVFDYGRQEVPSQQLGPERAVLQALRELREIFAAGWPQGEVQKTPNAAWVDSGYLTDVIYNFATESGSPWMAADGYGSAQDRKQFYSKPKTTGATVRHIGEGYHFAYQPQARVLLAEVNADQWKSWSHERLTSPLDKPGALTLFNAPSMDHLSFAKHLTAEKQVEEFIAGKGLVKKWIREKRNNHWFDCLYNACAAGHACGVRLVPAVKRIEAEQDALPVPSRVREMRFRR